VAQEVEPAWHGFAGVQLPPAMHATHEPAPSQTSLVPHGVPAEALAPVSPQVRLPVAQVVWPMWHAFVGVQTLPPLHGAHAPLLHTWPVPQLVPSFTFDPVSWQTEVPVAQDVRPV
jgi:hypothetical protein